VVVVAGAVVVVVVVTATTVHTVGQFAKGVCQAVVEHSKLLSRCTRLLLDDGRPSHFQCECCGKMARLVQWAVAR
jgi:hypothetical protein